MAAHLEEQQELDNFKYFWKTTGKWLFALLILAALGYLGYTVYQNRKVSQNQEAAAVLANIVEKAQSKAPQSEINAELTKLQQSYPHSISAAQATLMAAATEFDAQRYDVAEGHLKWVLSNQKDSLIQALAAQRLGVVLLQQKKYDAALAALDTPVEADFAPPADGNQRRCLCRTGKKPGSLKKLRTGFRKNASRFCRSRIGSNET